MSGSYEGLAAYQRQKPDPLAQRSDESEEAWRRRIAPILRHTQDAEIAEELWAAHRARIDQPVGTGSGLFGRAESAERAVAAGTLGFGGDQKLDRLGHLASTAVPGSIAVPRLYAADIEPSPYRRPGDELRSSGEGWFV